MLIFTNFPLGGSAAREESLHLRPVFLQVVIVDVLYPVDVEHGWLVEVVRERHLGPVDLEQGVET